MDTSTKRIVYKTQDGTPYSDREIQEEIRHFIQFGGWPSQFAEKMSAKGFKEKEVIEALYVYVMSIIDWEHPSTVLDQMDEESVQYILEEKGV